MQENGFWEEPTKKTIKLQEILAQKQDFPSLVSVSSQDTLSQVIEVMQKLNISQVPVIENSHIIGSLNEAALMKLLHEGISFSNQKVGAFMQGKRILTLTQNMLQLEPTNFLCSLL
ncbi:MULTISPECIES: CBS domain-containing protein [unclassified Microcoleus]|uniref:CBS domain-containing protein n=1 Tax=unclassified Microcoleus TaxID=2642155 RepID=UPI002FD2B9BD